MPSSGGRFGVNEPPPAAITTTLAMNRLPASVASAEAAVGQPLQAHRSRSPRWNVGAERLDLLQQPVGQLLAGDDRAAPGMS